MLADPAEALLKRTTRDEGSFGTYRENGVAKSRTRLSD